MQEIRVLTETGESLTNLVQWDRDIYIYLTADKINKNYQVHFYNSESKEALVCLSEFEDGTLKVKIPNDLLKQPYIIFGYVILDDEYGQNGCNKAEYCFKINVKKKPIPSDFIHVDSDDYVVATKILEEAQNYANNAKESAENAKTSKDKAENSAIDSAKSAANAKSSEIEAANSVKIAEALKSDVEGLKSEIQELKNDAKQSANNAAQSATNANNSAIEAAKSEKHTKELEEVAASIVAWTNAVIDDSTLKKYRFGIDNGLVYISDEFDEQP